MALFNHQLSIFVCVADCGSFNKAAERLYVSPPSVMKQINALEKHLDLKLFDRTNQGIRLTEAGQVIYRHAQFLFDYSAKAVEEARHRAAAVQTTFRIGSSLLNPCKPFMDIWYQVNQEFPNHKLHIVPFEDDHRGILSEIAALGEKYDFLVAACDSEKWLDLCGFQQLGTYRMCCAVSREHPLAQKERLTINDLYGETLLIGKRGDSVCVDRIRDIVGQYPAIKIEDTQQFYDIGVFNRCAQTRNVMLTLECWRDVHPGLVTLPCASVSDHAVPYGLLYARAAADDILKFLSVIRSAQA